MDSGDGVCRTISNACTLRAAIMEANALAGDDTIDVPRGNFQLFRTGYDDTALNGDLDITGRVTIRGAGVQATIVTGTFARPNVDRIFDIRPDIAATIERLTITGGDATTVSTGANGGGIRVGQGAGLILRQVLVRGNRALGGGGVNVRARGTLSLYQSAVEVNDVGDGDGGGILAEEDASLYIEQSGVFENSARRGGGVFLRNATMGGLNSTVSLNTATRNGGGIWVDHQHVPVRSGSILMSVTIAFNRASPTLGGNIWDNSPPNSGRFELGDSIVTNGDTVNCGGRPIGERTPNLESANTCGFSPQMGSLINTNPSLVALFFYSPPFRIHALASTSPAVDAIGCGTPVDQRGVSRPQDGNRDGRRSCDFGAYELIGP